jgi:hypothetical protein
MSLSQSDVDLVTWIAVMADYALYIDDSGHPDDQAFVVVAGFIATEKEWLDFDPAWKSALKDNGLAEPFHMTDFMRQKRPTQNVLRLHGIWSMSFTRTLGTVSAEALISQPTGALTKFMR